MNKEVKLSFEDMLRFASLRHQLVVAQAQFQQELGDLIRANKIPVPADGNIRWTFNAKKRRITFHLPPMKETVGANANDGPRTG